MSGRGSSTRGSSGDAWAIVLGNTIVDGVEEDDGSWFKVVVHDFGGHGSKFWSSDLVFDFSVEVRSTLALSLEHFPFGHYGSASEADIQRPTWTHILGPQSQSPKPSIKPPPMFSSRVALAARTLRSEAVPGYGHFVTPLRRLVVDYDDRLPSSAGLRCVVLWDLLTAGNTSRRDC